MKRTALLALISLLILSVGQAALAQGVGPILVVNTSFLNVRTADGPQFGVVATVTGGTELPVLGTNTNNSWYLVSTPMGPGWVDVSFTLPRGDFSNVPVVKPTSGTPLSTGGPYTIALYPPLPGTANTGAQSSVQGSWRASIDVFSVNFRSQPADNGAILTTIYRSGLGTNDYPVLAFSFDARGVRWVALSIPNYGQGWIEADKTTLRQVTPAAASAVTTTTTTTTSQSVIIQSAAHVVVNTSYQNIRFGPGPQYVVIAVVPGGTSLEAIGVTSDTSWYLVRGTFGQGWISSEFVLFRGSFSSVPVINGAF